MKNVLYYFNTKYRKEVRAVQTKGTKKICDNRQARHEYFILERYEAGIALQGNEVKSIRLGHVNLKDAWCDITDGELFVKGMHISPYEKDGLFRTDPMRVRKLLMHHQEINRMFGKVKQDSFMPGQGFLLAACFGLPICTGLS